MSFPYHDKNWTEVADFIDSYRTPNEKILANDIFWWRYNEIYRYANFTSKPEAEYDWVILHKGELQHYPLKFLDSLTDQYNPVYANKVFILWTKRDDVKFLEKHPDLDCISGLLDERRLIEFEPQPADDFVFPTPGVIQRFQNLTKAELAKAMDRFYLAGGYEYATLRDKTFYLEIDRWLKLMSADFNDVKLLDVACGEARVSKIISAFDLMIEVDISWVATEKAKQDGSDDNRRNALVMDAENLAFHNESFDVVTFIEAAEHVHDFDRTISEMARVLKPNGKLIMNAANADSLHHRLCRALGYPYFRTNYQHIREYGFTETTNILESHGLKIEWAEGIFLYPYWGVPGVDEYVREVTDQNSELVEALRLLGERSGPEFAYCYMLSARKVS